LHEYKYYNFDIPEIEEFPFLLYHKEHEFRGLNVTIPYKESVMKYLDEIDDDAQKIGAVNTIKITDDNKLIGYNTDVYGVSRKKAENKLLYSMLNEQIIQEYLIIINCTPVGTFPNIEEAPSLPYEFITNRHLMFDLIYNPRETKFLKEGRNKKAVSKNGYEMLQLQAEKSWEIWNF
jgi:shikimate dehydrogenase